MQLTELKSGIHHARRPALGLRLALLTLLTGCQSLTGTSSFARLRVIDLSSDAGTVDVYHGNNAVAFNLSYGTLTSYVPLVPGNSVLTIDVAGSREVLSSIKGTFSAGGQYTLLVTHPAASLQPLLLNDQQPPADAGEPTIRVIHQAFQAGAVDVYLVPAGQRLSTIKPLVTNLAPGAITGYLAVPASVFSVVMMPAGAVLSFQSGTLHMGTQVNYETGSARSLIVLDAQPSHAPGVQVITTQDAEPAN